MLLEDLPKPSARARVLGVAVILATAALAIAALKPPAPTLMDAPPEVFSTGRALQHVRIIANAPHPVGSEAHAQVRRYVMASFEQLGLEVVQQPATVGTSVAGSNLGASLVNVAARLRGQGEPGAVLLAAHYDSVANSPGASDDAAGVATLLETARALTVGDKPRHDVIFVVTDGEESAMLGAVAFVEHPWFKDVRVAMNFEARGTSGPSAMYDTSPGNAPLIEAVATTPRPVGSSLISALAKALPNDSDASIWRRAGAPTLAFAYADGLFRYHTGTDSLEFMDARSLEHHGTYSLALARHFANGSLQDLRGEDATYFDLFGRWLVHYSPSVERVLGVCLLAAYIVLVWAHARRRRLVAPNVVGAMSVLFAALVACIVVASLVQLIIGGAAGVPLSLAFADVFVWVYLGVAAALVLTAWHIGTRRLGASHVAFGGLAVWALFAAVVSLWAPTASFGLTWPLAFTLVGLALAPRLGRFAYPALVACALPAVILDAPIVYTTHVMAGGQSGALTMVVFALLLAPLAPVLVMSLGDDLPRARNVLVLATLVSLLAGVAAAGYGPARPSIDNVLYAMDADQRSAAWLVLDAKPNAYAARFLPSEPKSALQPAFSRSSTPRFYTEAPVIDVPPPTLEVVSDIRDGERRTLRLRVISPRRARCLSVWETKSANVLAAKQNGAALVPFVRFSAETDKKMMRAMTGEVTLDGWNLDFCGNPGEPLELELTTLPAEGLSLRVVDASDGLPPIGAAQSGRPPDTITGLWGERTLVSRLVEIPPRND